MAVCDAYDGPKLERMLRFRLNKRLDEISMAGDFQQIVFKLIAAAEMEGWTLQLLNAARQSNPGNAALLKFSQQFGLAATTPELERVVREELRMVDITRWRSRLGEIEGQVCRVECKGAGGTIYGPGILLGPDLLITNHHVMAEVISVIFPNPSGVASAVLVVSGGISLLLMVGRSLMLLRLRVAGALSHEPNGHADCNTPPIRLPGRLLKPLRHEMQAAFNHNDLRLLVREDLDQNLEVIVEGGTLGKVISNLLDWAERTGKLEELVRALQKARPEKKELHSIAADVLSFLSQGGDVAGGNGGAQSG
jgi:hypothetical protein